MISGKVSMVVNRLKYFCIEIQKSINNANPSLMKQLFQLGETNKLVQTQDIHVPKVNQVSYGEKSLRYYGPKIWNSLPVLLRTSKNLKVLEILSKVRMILHVIVGFVRFELD